MMASADVLVALLESGASCYSVPSKVLTYHCAGRALLAALPDENLAAHIIEGQGSGLVVSPESHEAFVAAGRKLVENAELCASMGVAARDYARETFDIGTIAGRFEEIVRRAVAAR